MRARAKPRTEVYQPLKVRQVAVERVLFVVPGAEYSPGSLLSRFVRGSDCKRDRVRVQLNDEGCWSLQKDWGLDVWASLFTEIYRVGGRVNGLSVALDDAYGVLDITRIRQYMGRIENRDVNQVRCLFSVMSDCYPQRTISGDRQADGVYFGDSKSLVSVGIVKMYLRAMKKNNDSHWLRVVVNLKGSTADKTSRKLRSSSIGETTAGILLRYLKFVEIVDDSNYGRWPLAPWWSNFLGSVKEVRVTGGFG